MADVDYEYEDVDYGYGDAEPEPANAPETDYGYGNADTDEDYGYGDAEPEQPVIEEPKHRPKRRCSVTKFNLDNSEALTAADRIRELRGTSVASTCSDDEYNSCNSFDSSGKKKSGKKGSRK